MLLHPPGARTTISPVVTLAGSPPLRPPAPPCTPLRAAATSVRVPCHLRTIITPLPTHPIRSMHVCPRFSIPSAPLGPCPPPPVLALPPCLASAASHLCLPKSLRRAKDTHFHVVPRSRKSDGITFTPQARCYSNLLRCLAVDCSSAVCLRRNRDRGWGHGAKPRPVRRSVAAAPSTPCGLLERSRNTRRRHHEGSYRSGQQLPQRACRHARLFRRQLLPPWTSLLPHFPHFFKNKKKRDGQGSECGPARAQGLVPDPPTHTCCGTARRSSERCL